jgi:uncharacterized protein (DUF2384 family)
MSSIPIFRNDFDGFVEFLRDTKIGLPTLSPSRFSEVMHIDLQTLASQAHVHRNTLQRAPASESVQRFLREAIRVIRAALDLNGDLERTIFWYRNMPIPTFGYKTAETLVTEHRTEDLLQYIDSLEAGPAG